MKATSAQSLDSFGLGAALSRIALVALVAVTAVLAACGGSADAPPPPEGAPPCTAVSITTQPADASVTAGQSATFTVVAAGTAPLGYQWQRNGVDIAGATSATYALATTALADSGALFHANVTNGCNNGNTTTRDATLTVTSSGPVLTLSPQPANTSVVAGSQASFTVGGTCSSGTLAIQWQRGTGSGASLTFADITGATATTYSFAAVLADNGAQFRAVLNCSGQSSTPSGAATLTVTPPGGVVLGLLNVVGLRDQADITAPAGIDQDPGGSFTFITLNRIKRLSADLTTITPVAGSVGSGSADGPAASATFNQPLGLTQDAAGNIYVADTGNHTIRRIAADGTVSTLAGLAGASGAADGTGTAARFNSPGAIALGPDGDLYVADSANSLVRRVTTAGVVTTYAGSSFGFVDGTPATSAQFRGPAGIAVAANGDVLVADNQNARIRRILRNGNVAGAVETLAGNGTVSAASPDGIGTAAVIANPLGIVVRGNTLTVMDFVGLVRQIDLTTKAVTTLTGSRSLGAGYADGTSTTARLSAPAYITAAAAGGFITSENSHALRLIGTAGDVRTIAATNAVGQTPTGVGTLAQEPFGLLYSPLLVSGNSLTVDPTGRVVVADVSTTEVRRIDATGVVTLVAGLTGAASNVVDGIGSEAQFKDLGISIASAPSGVLYVGDDFCVRRIGTDNAVTTLAGSTTTSGGVDGSATTARFGRILGLAVGPTGDVFAADTANNAVRRIDAAGNVTTYAGVIGQSARVDGPIATARFISPGTVAFAPDGSLYVSDGNTVRKIAADGSSVTTSVTANNSVKIFAIAVDAAGTLYYDDGNGLWMLAAGAATSTLLIPSSSAGNVLGASPQLYQVPQSIAVLGPKQLVIISFGQLLVATLP